jgi:hypothetical protein
VTTLVGVAWLLFESTQVPSRKVPTLSPRLPSQLPATGRSPGPPNWNSDAGSTRLRPRTGFSDPSVNSAAVRLGAVGMSRMWMKLSGQ